MAFSPMESFPHGYIMESSNSYEPRSSILYRLSFKLLACRESLHVIFLTCLATIWKFYSTVPQKIIKKELSFLFFCDQDKLVTVGVGAADLDKLVFSHQVLRSKMRFVRVRKLRN